MSGTRRRVTVCSACGTAACWNGVLMCEDARTAGTREIEVDPCPSTLRDGRSHPSDDHPSAALIALSRWIDAANAHRAPDTNLWSRVSKAAEEGGEAMDALRGYLGENPRKGVTGSLDEVVEELLDTAVAALGAVEHIREHDGQALALLNDKILRVHTRAFGGAA